MRERTSSSPAGSSSLTGKVRFHCANRRQIEWRDACWDDLLTDDHPARAVWQFVEGLDLSPVIATYRAREGAAGANPIDVRILMALWLYATLRGIGSARELARRCAPEGEIPFQWMCGGVSVNHHTLSTFRTTHVEFLDDLLTQGVALLLYEDRGPRCTRRCGNVLAEAIRMPAAGRNRRPWGIGGSGWERRRRKRLIRSVPPPRSV